MLPRVLICDNEEPPPGARPRRLEGIRCDVVEAEDGDESLELARRLRPDVVILDMMMPGRSGLDVLRELRRDDELRSAQVIMLTARAQAADRDTAVEAGPTASSRSRSARSSWPWSPKSC